MNKAKNNLRPNQDKDKDENMSQCLDPTKISILNSVTWTQTANKPKIKTNTNQRQTP